MSKSIIRTQPINVTGLWRSKIVPSGAKELMGMIDEIRRSEVERDEHILETFDELANETMEILKKKGKSLTVEDFLNERER